MIKYPYLFIFLLLLFAVSCSNSKKSTWTKAAIISFIQKKCDLVLEEPFHVLKDSIHYTEGAFDLDYTYYLTIIYEEAEESRLVEEITTTPLFDSIIPRNHPDSLSLRAEKGLWRSEDNGFNFSHFNTEATSREPFYLNVDTLVNRIDFILTHL